MADTVGCVDNFGNHGCKWTVSNWIMVVNHTASTWLGAWNHWLCKRWTALRTHNLDRLQVVLLASPVQCCPAFWVRPVQPLPLGSHVQRTVKPHVTTQGLHQAAKYST